MYLRAPLSFGLIVICVVVFLLQMFWGDSVFSWMAFSLTVEDQEGARKDLGLSLIKSGQYWRLITPIFMHGGPLHLILNLVSFRFLGEMVEIRKGALKTALIVLLAALVGNFAQFQVFAFGGYVWIKGYTDPENGLSLNDSSANMMMAWLMLGILAPMLVEHAEQMGFPFNMANLCHAGGLIVGIILGLLRF